MGTTERGTFERKGIKPYAALISAGEILNAIAEGNNIDVEYAVIDGDSVRKACSREAQDGQNCT